MNYLFDFDGTLITALQIDYVKLKNELKVILETDNEITPMVEKIREYSKINNDDNNDNDNNKIQIKITNCFNLIDKYEIEALIHSKINYKWLDLYLNSNKKIIVSRNGLKVIDKFFKDNNLPYPDYISCRDNSTELKPSIKQLDFLKSHNGLIINPDLSKDKSNLTLVGDSDIDSLLAKNYGISYLDVNNNKLIYIDIFIPFYNHNNDYHRTHLTKKIFKHYANIKKILQDKAIISFTLLGSEKDISKKLAESYFPNLYYYEFNQDLIQNDNRIYNDFNKMFEKKMNSGVSISISKNPNILLCAGSNDYIPIKFFHDVINFFKSDIPQVYGIDNFYNGCNCVYFAKYNTDKEEFINNNEIWWDGISNFCGREKYHYCGGIIGVNKNLLDNNAELLKTWGFDEGETERVALNTKNVAKFNSKNLYFFNIKTINDKDLNTLSELNKVNLKKINIYSDIDENNRQIILNDLEYYKSL